MPLRSAPGLSLGSTSEPPDAARRVHRWRRPAGHHGGERRSDERLAFLAETTSALAYRIATPGTVCVRRRGRWHGDPARPAARRAHVDAVELNPQVAELLRDGVPRLHRRSARATRACDLHVGDARGFLDRTRATLRLDPDVADGRRGGGGLGGLNEDYLHTVEAFRLYLGHLEPGGFLSITRWAQVPPRDGLKLVATVVAALEASGVTDAAERLLMIRGWQTVHAAREERPVTADEVRRLREFCDALSFDVVWFPGIRPADVNVYNQLPAPWYYDGVRALLGTGRDDFIAGYPFDIRPATDDRPYFQNFFRWPMLAEAWRAKDRGGMALLEAGYLLLVTARSFRRCWRGSC